MENGLYERIKECHPALERGRVHCPVCRREATVDAAHCLRHGWPECCGATMELGPRPPARRPARG